MRINVYGEELTNRVEVVSKEVSGRTFYGVRVYLYTPITSTDAGVPISGPFFCGDTDRSSAVTFWSENPLHIRMLLNRMSDAINTVMAL